MIGALYHSPNPIYQADLLLTYLEHNVEMLARAFPDSLIILAEDLNQLKDSQLVQATGLEPKVHQLTRGSSTLDKLHV